MIPAHRIMKQPLLGIFATVLVIILSLGFISLFDFPFFAGWVSYCLMCVIPMQIVIGVTWGTNHPGPAAKRTQPAKGVLLSLTSLLAGIVVAPAYFVISGGGVTPPAPMLMHLIIVS